jgi:hypothetical protein
VLVSRLRARPCSELPIGDRGRGDVRSRRADGRLDRQRLGRSAGRLDTPELRAVDEALMLVLGL